MDARFYIVSTHPTVFEVGGSTIGANGPWLSQVADNTVRSLL
jgi:hypothetical protein